MNFGNWWGGLGLAAAPSLPVASDRLILTHAAPIRQVMGDLIRSSRALLVHSLDGSLPASVRLCGLNATDVTLTLDGDLRKRALLDGADLSLTAPTSMGSVFFTLNRVRETARDYWRSALPKEVIRVQSREYFRVAGVCGLRHVARLNLPGSASVSPLDNLSETGLAFRVVCPLLVACETVGTSTLQLDCNILVLPALRIIFKESCGARQWRVGAAIDGLSQVDARVLRRWIDVVETASRR